MKTFILIQCLFTLNLFAKTMHFNSKGQLKSTSFKSADGNTYFYNGQGKLKGTSREVFGKRVYYDKLGRQTGTADKKNNQTNFYDNLGRLKKTKRQSFGQTIYSDPLGTTRAIGRKGADGTLIIQD